MAWNELPAGLEVVSGAGFSGTTSYQQAQEMMFCPGDPPWTPDATIPVISGAALTASDSHAADNVSALASYELLQVYSVGGGGGGCSGGWRDCEAYRRGDPGFPGYFTSVSVSGGQSGEIRSTDDGTLRPILNPAQANWTPLIGGLFMRPTPLEWDGQDPTNGANRSVWLPSEVIGVLGAVQAQFSMADTSGYDISVGSAVRALNVISGVPREPGSVTSVDEPVICFV